MPAEWVAIGSVAALLAVHLTAEARGAPALRALGKVGASAALVALALALGVEGAFERGILAGLVLSVLGDALLLSRRRLAFLGGLVAFLLAHVAYAAAFARVTHPSLALALVVLAATGTALRWLWAGLGDLRIPVVAYCAVISAMLWLALGVERPAVRAGALLFYLSDLLVARDRFVKPGMSNRVVGLPLYYAGQLLLALAVG
ncbi:lysoplasmalogenase family protein [Anaeromyxobacter terrae]|uniref:lysoplasmalogenase family protein n=1 Tax=Anaeromyxobacter terrae TaxID=2925406 RepID=UPI001F5AB3A7|nr:lysoplasmalogenase [Anaeromyxobacter sp. SG22]